MKKLKIFFIVFIVILIFLIIGVKVYKNMSAAEENIENNTSDMAVEDKQNINSNSEQENVVIENNISEPEEVSKNGKIIASNGFEFDEQDLKDKINIYLIYENFMQDYFIPEQELENANIVDYANEAKVFIGLNLVSKQHDNPSEEEVRKAVEEFCGEHYEDFIDTAEYWLAFDGDNAYRYVQAGDYDPIGYCNSIESITEQDGKYTVTFVYSRPSDSDFMDNNIDRLPKYKKQFTFVYHDDAQYTKYQLTELSFLKGEEVK